MTIETQKNTKKSNKKLLVLLLLLLIITLVGLFSFGDLLLIRRRL